ncbi:chemotaxis protein CheC [Desertifilum sp. FACHB-1129]|uniref:Chemotaxis protein CheC n=2 Tax=Cyanophyceae TaxID=3028117 RepID=A0A1E5QER6_9CYAN|nr:MULTISPECIES: chemotaxis protein CheC [Cyanophyceae]MBD2312517.1 chemotaxis protein CheC [Desertifilum sp. FACHB-1129]MBD2323459.1 chemotaxis protein CheC [Desertifilum sp. FACHB-866]MBD2333304.1 chemotaxis protein CheC [Desertifilum sp. FACHB-868]MCD8487778.1 chemotaxis protein CheC [Desertifilum sp.]MDA0212916.1 chemotaxis protein CheC [Cyanobacteria bacterium FC1]MDI9638627.1 chemotaxis protein CheC [Geitlerinema splendidum]
MSLTLEQIDILQELVNIGVGQAASILNEMLGSPICLNIPDLQSLSLTQLQTELESRFESDLISTVQLGFEGFFSGSAELIFPTESASTLVSLLTGEKPGTPDLEAVKIGTLLEVGNIVLNGVVGTVSNLFSRRLDYSLPTYAEDRVSQLLKARNLKQDVNIILAHTHFIIEKLQINGEVLLIFKVGSFDALLDALALELESE